MNLFSETEPKDNQYTLGQVKALPHTILTLRGDDKVRIFDGANQKYWKPDAKGYTAFTNEAGIFTLAEAYKYTKHCGGPDDKGIEFIFI